MSETNANDAKYGDYDKVLDEKVDQMLVQVNSILKSYADDANDEKKEEDEQPARKRQRLMLFAAPSTTEKGIKDAPTIEMTGGVEPKMKDAPTIEMTGGVEPELTRMCAAFSGQMYRAKKVGDFDLSIGELKPEVVLLDTELDLTTPPMAIAVVGKKMVVAFRGSATLMDWVMDFALSPLPSRSWAGTAPNVRAQGAFSALVEGYLSKHEKFIVDKLNDDDTPIEELIFTGHSLGGGVAQVFHLFVQGELEKEGSLWSNLKDKLTVRTVAISAPMTTINLKGPNHEDGKKKSDDFIEKVGKNTINIIYESDPVPHAYGDLSYIFNLVKAAIPEIGDELDFPWYLNNGLVKWLFGINGRIGTAFEEFAESQKDLFKVMVQFRHIGKVIYYKSTESKPEVYEDKELHYQGESGEKIFRNIDFEGKEGKNIKVAGASHTFLISAAGLAYNVEP